MSALRNLLRRPRRQLVAGSAEDRAVQLARAGVSGRRGLAIMRRELAAQERQRLATYDAAAQKRATADELRAAGREAAAEHWMRQLAGDNPTPLDAAGAPSQAALNGDNYV